MENEKRESAKAYSRYKKIIDLLNLNNDQAGLKHVQQLLEICERYVVVVANVERIGIIHRFRTQTDEQEIEKFRNLDQLRKITHNALISQLKLVNRYLFRKYGDEISIGGIYSFYPMTLADEDRSAIGEWAYCLVDALQRRGILKKI
ncbi:DUF3232 domain-containing protein [Candidatus Woesearchaeota archaeon]|nr:DUF3232 domain-containing protein [Candidatus Woesearchaeota archaeon]